MEDGRLDRNPEDPEAEAEMKYGKFCRQGWTRNEFSDPNFPQVMPIHT